jgi:hypothetical protein
MLFLLVSWTINDQPLYFDTRTMALPYVAIMILTVCIISARLRQAAWPAKSWRRFGANSALIVVVALSTINSFLWLQQSYVDGLGYATEPWRSSELLRYVRASDEPRPIYSNAPDFIYTFTGKTAAMVPHKIHPWTKQPNDQWAREIAAMGKQLNQPNAVLIYFNGEGRLWYLPSEHELEKYLPLHIIKTTTDGKIYSLKQSLATSQN